MINEWAFAYGPPSATGKIKVSPEDFYVEEVLGFNLSGSGEHLFLQIEKKLLTTEEMVRLLAKTFGIKPKQISYAGLKDKYATTVQWFSIHLPGLADPELDELNTEYYRLLSAKRHNKKLKIGALKENQFKIKIKDFHYEKTDIDTRIHAIFQKGVPNYFGAQRFGNQGSSLEQAKNILFANKKVKNHYLRSIYYSAARAFLFNQILNNRVNSRNWDMPVTGDVVMLAGTRSIFQVDAVSEEIKKRALEQDIFPAAPLWGVGKEQVRDHALEMQMSALDPWRDWCLQLEAHGLQKSYRSMVLLPQKFEFKENIFHFSLPKGTFATTLLRELLQFETGNPHC